MCGEGVSWCSLAQGGEGDELNDKSEAIVKTVAQNERTVHIYVRTLSNSAHLQHTPRGPRGVRLHSRARIAGQDPVPCRMKSAPPGAMPATCLTIERDLESWPCGSLNFRTPGPDRAHALGHCGVDRQRIK